jgi:hypothetical protein
VGGVRTSTSSSTQTTTNSNTSASGSTIARHLNTSTSTRTLTTRTSANSLDMIEAFDCVPIPSTIADSAVIGLRAIVEYDRTGCKDGA